MPLREYVCPICKTKFDRLSHKFDEDSDTYPCPQCGHMGELVEFSVPAKRDPDHGIQR